MQSCTCCTSIFNMIEGELVQRRASEGVRGLHGHPLVRAVDGVGTEKAPKDEPLPLKMVCLDGEKMSTPQQTFLVRHFCDFTLTFPGVKCVCDTRVLKGVPKLGNRLSYSRRKDPSSDRVGIHREGPDHHIVFPICWG